MMPSIRVSLDEYELEVLMLALEGAATDHESDDEAALRDRVYSKLKSAYDRT